VARRLDGLHMFTTSGSLRPLAFARTLLLHTRIYNRPCIHQAPMYVPRVVLPQQSLHVVRHGGHIAAAGPDGLLPDAFHGLWVEHVLTFMAQAEIKRCVRVAEVRAVR